MRNTLIFAGMGLLILGGIFIGSFNAAEQSFGATILFPTGGGTGSSTLTGIIVGNGTSPVNSLIIGNNLTFSGHTLSATDSTASSTLLSDNNTFSGANIFTTQATTTFANGLNLTTTGCFAINNTCLQTIVSSASAYKQAVRYASTSTLPTNTYNNGSGGVGATITAVGNGAIPTIDGTVPSLGDRILVKNESTGANNGIYTVTTIGVAGLSPFVLTRATDYNSSADVFPGVANFVNSGTINANTCWILTNTSAVTIGSTALTYADECGAGSFTGTYPIIITGTTISTAFGTTTNWVTGQVAAVNANGNVYSTATTTLAGGGPITVSNSPVVLGSSGAVLGCTAASASVNGCIASTDWSLFNNKVSSSSLAALDSFTHPAANTSATTSLFIINSATSTITNLLMVNSTTTNATTTNLTVTNLASTSRLTISSLKFSLLATDGTGNVISTTTIGSSFLSANTISGVTLGNNLNALSVSGSMTGTTYNGSAAVSDWTLNMANSNTWTARQIFGAASTTDITTSNSLFLTQLAGNGPLMLDLNKKVVQYATSTAYGTCNAGQVIAWSGVTGTLVCMATSSAATSLSGGTAGMLTAWVTSSTVTATSTPTIAGLYATSSTATSTFTGPLIIGGAQSPFLSYSHPYMRVGTTTCPTNPSFYAYLEVCGSDNTTNGVQMQIGNSLRSSSAFGSLTFGNDRSNSNTTNYAAISFLSSGYNDTTYGTGSNIPEEFVFENREGGFSFEAASTTNTASTSIKFFLLGNATANEAARFNAGAQFLVGTTSPSWSLITLASSTRPQLALSDNNAGGVSWSFRSIANSLYIATSTPTATSTSPAFSINPNGFGNFWQGVAVGSTTPWAALSIQSTLPSEFAISTTTTAQQQLFAINNVGHIQTAAIQAATSTAITLDWNATPPQVEYQISVSAVTITIINATNTPNWGSRKLVWICNMNGTAGALTWGGVEWIGSAPTQTTTQNVCDTYSFDVTRATSSSAYKVAGTAGTGFK